METTTTTVTEAARVVVEEVGVVVVRYAFLIRWRLHVDSKHWNRTTSFTETTKPTMMMSSLGIKAVVGIRRTPRSSLTVHVYLCVGGKEKGGGTGSVFVFHRAIE